MGASDLASGYSGDPPEDAKAGVGGGYIGIHNQVHGVFYLDLYNTLAGGRIKQRRAAGVMNSTLKPCQKYDG
ncbi:hypothetical protein GCM10027172_20000 [Halomonas garicola]